MKLLLDEHLSDRALPHLEALYPRSTHVKAVSLTRANDAHILDYAREHGFVVVSKDEDLFNLVTLNGHPPKLIHLHTGNCRTRDLITLLRQAEPLLRRFEAQNEAGIIVLPVEE